MNKTEEKIQQLEKQIIEQKIDREKKLLITEMKKIGIEELPYSYSALKQFIDTETMDFHYNKHYKGYVDKLNDALAKKKYGDLELEQIIKTISRFDKTIRNNAGGAFNHALFWNMLTPKPKKLQGVLYQKITKEFGSFPAFKKKFETIAKDRFGSGWVWLVLTAKNTLKIMSTPNQDNPLMNVIDDGGFPLLGLDLWEHAYYLKYRNKRDEYITNFWKVVDWDFVTKLYEMKVETKLQESIKFKKVLSEGKSEMCSATETELYRILFNVNREIKWTYMKGINKIIKEVFNEYYVEKPEGNTLPGVYNFENNERSVINKLNTNYTSFCILLNDVNQVIESETNRQKITFKGKSPKEQVDEVNRFIAALDYFKYRIFNTESSTLQNLMRVLEEKNKAGSDREKITASILKRHLGKDFKVDVIGELGDKKDAIQGIDVEITKDNNTQTGQIKPFREMIVKNDEITLRGTANVKVYKTDLMIFQKRKNVLVFNKKPRIVNGNFVFPKDSLLYDIQ